MWCLWRERNARNFEGCERTILDLLSCSFSEPYLTGCGLFSLSNFLELFYFIFVLLDLNCYASSTYLVLDAFFINKTYCL